MALTKIICTLGPKTESEDMLAQLMDAGMNIARLNFSHSNHEWFRPLIQRIHKVREGKQYPCSILLDTKGPEVRTGDAPAEVFFEKGKSYTMGALGSGADLEVTYPHLVRDCKQGQLIQLDGGLLQVIVQSTAESTVTVLSEGTHTITPRRHVNIPGVHLDLPVLSEKDKADIAFGVSEHIDIIAASFINTGSDITIIRDEIAKHTSRFIPIIAKIESQTGLDNIEDILHVADGIMIARGDLGVEVPMHMIPKIQKQLVDMALMHQKPVIMATHMLVSMVNNPTPTRAEMTDVGNAIYHSVDAIMLSEETSVGAYPVGCVDIMAKIAESIEQDVPSSPWSSLGEEMQDEDILSSGIELASRVEAKALVLITDIPDRVRLLSQLRPMAPIHLFTTSTDVYGYGNLMRGVYVHKIEETTQSTELLLTILDKLKNSKAINVGEKVILFSSLLDENKQLDTVQVRTI